MQHSQKYSIIQSAFSHVIKLPPHFCSTPHRVCLVPVAPLAQVDLVDPLEMLAVLVSLVLLVSG